MELVIRRQPTTDFCTLGQLFVDGQPFCYTLEPSEDRKNYPAIPAGRYKVIVSYSTRFQRQLPLIVGIPGRIGVRIHPGNTEEDTDGCILLGTSQTAHAVQHSRAACELFQSKIAPVLARQESVWLSIEDQPVKGKSA